MVQICERVDRLDIGPGYRVYFGKDEYRPVILLTGDIDTGKAVLHDYINATIDFEGERFPVKLTGGSASLVQWATKKRAPRSGCPLAHLQAAC